MRIGLNSMSTFSSAIAVSNAVRVEIVLTPATRARTRTGASTTRWPWWTKTSVMMSLYAIASGQSGA